MNDAAGEPVKVVIERRARPDETAAVEAWTRDLLLSAQRGAALEGSSVLRREGGEHLILLRFASQADLDAWQASPDVAALLRRGAEISEAASPPVVRTGLETWFTLPGNATAATPPPRWKMALVTWSALLPQIVLLSFVVPKSLPFLVNVAISTAIPVAMLTWVVMPRLTRMLHVWLYSKEVPA